MDFSNSPVYKQFLPFQENIFKEFLKEPLGLWIVAPGLGLDYILETFIMQLKTEIKGTKELILILIVENHEYLYRKFNLYKSNEFKLINTDYNQDTRELVWKEGGICFVTSRVILVDIIRGKVPLNRVNRILLNMPRSYMISDSSTEAFILRLFARYCYQNPDKVMRIQSFCQNPLHFLGNKFSEVLDSLHLLPRHAKIWPRFRTSVKENLHNQLEVVDIELSLSPIQAKIHQVIFQLISSCTKEIQQGRKSSSVSNSSVHSASELPELTVEQLFSSSFFKRLKESAIYHKMSKKHKDFMRELDVLRKILIKLIYDDAVEFYDFVCRSQGQIFTYDGKYLSLDNWDQIQILSKARLYTKDSTELKADDSMLTNISSSSNTTNTTTTKDSDNFLDSINNQCIGSIKDKSKPFGSNAPVYKLILEENTKWRALVIILDEIEKLCISDPNLITTPILLLTHEVSTAETVTKYLLSKSNYLLEKFTSFLLEKLETSKNQTDWCVLFDKLIKRTQKKVDNANEFSDSEESYFGLLGNSSISNPTENRPTIIIHPFKDVEAFLHNSDIHFVILYDTNHKIMREIECFKASRPGHFLKLYNLVYRDSAEKIRFSSSINSENTAFSKVIEERGSMAIKLDEKSVTKNQMIPESSKSSADQNLENSKLEQIKVSADENFVPGSQKNDNCHSIGTNDNDEDNRIDKKDEDNENVNIDCNNDNNNTTANNKVSPNPNSRTHIEQKLSLNTDTISEIRNAFKLPINTSSVNQISNFNKEMLIVVDIREFRSKLPAILDLRNINIVPVTLPVADYVLSPDIGVERKAIADLNQSLASGRLFIQLEQLVRVYQYPILLIEYDLSEAFDSLDRLYNFKTKLVQLTIHFNTVRIIWSRSPYETAEIFLKLKEGKPEPTLFNWEKYHKEDWIDENLEKFEALDLLKRIPGISERNWRNLVNGTKIFEKPAFNTNTNKINLNPQINDSEKRESSANEIKDSSFRKTANTPLDINLPEEDPSARTSQFETGTNHLSSSLDPDFNSENIENNKIPIDGSRSKRKKISKDKTLKLNRLCDLPSFTIPQLECLLGLDVAKRVYNFVHQECNVSSNSLPKKLSTRYSQPKISGKK